MYVLTSVSSKLMLRFYPRFQAHFTASSMMKIWVCTLRFEVIFSSSTMPWRWKTTAWHTWATAGGTFSRWAVCIKGSIVLHTVQNLLHPFIPYLSKYLHLSDSDHILLSQKASKKFSHSRFKTSKSFLNLYTLFLQETFRTSIGLRVS